MLSICLSFFHFDPGGKYPNRLIAFLQNPLVKPLLPPIIFAAKKTSQQRRIRETLGTGNLIQNGPWVINVDQMIQLDPTSGMVRYIDNACMQVIQKPSFFDVVATGTEPVS